MSGLRSRLSKPHYLFRPGQAVTRLRALSSTPTGRGQQVQLPWGARIDCLRDERVGSSLSRTGVYDLPVSEALARLIDPGETVVDAGANIGYMTSLMAWRAGPGGHVLSFEPNPEVLPSLERNVDRWRLHGSYAPITVVPVALSDADGHATLRAAADFQQNMGTASLSEHAGDETAQSWLVETRRLDQYLVDRPIGVLKLDVEDHELAVMRGANEALARRGVRDILLEDRTEGDSPKLAHLRTAGYEIFAVDQRLLGLRLTQSSLPTARRVAYDPPTFLATLNPARATERLSGLGWMTLTPRMFGHRA
jgi:FkbM family methyltransferase